jgi:ABC-type nitrate/sulfonate/bicarbonate transport system ATPase subunit
MAYLEVRGLEKSYVTPRGRTHVLGGVELALEESEFVAVWDTRGPARPRSSR